jgi:hypothetical protein
MHPRTREVLAHLDTYHTQLLRAVEAIPAPLREREPGEGRWSVAGVLEHLAIVDESIAGRLTNALAVAREAGLSHEADEGSILDRLDFDMILDRSRPRSAAPQSHPRQDVTAGEALAHYERAYAKVCDLVREYDGFALGSVTAQHPALGDIDMYQWLLFLGAHEGRHADQIREIGAALGAENAQGATVR